MDNDNGNAATKETIFNLDLSKELSPDDEYCSRCYVSEILNRTILAQARLSGSFLKAQLLRIKESANPAIKTSRFAHNSADQSPRQQSPH
jgi:hypothetical protein